MRWILLLPVALLAGIAGSLVGGIVASPFGQAAADTGSALVGPFAFVFAAGLVAPSRRQEVSIVAAALVAILALGTFLLSTLTSVEEFAALPQRARILSPIAQFLGALYAPFIFAPFVTGATLGTLWREVFSLGTLTAMFGVSLAVAGLVVGLVGYGWFVLAVGGGVVGLAVVTWLFPIIHPLLRLRKAEADLDSWMRAATEKATAERTTER
jgi:MFS family permease